MNKHAPPREQAVLSDDPEADDYEAYSRRMTNLVELLEKRGGFSPGDVTKALCHPGASNKETTAHWLRTELKKLRKQEKIIGAAPVLKQKLLPRLTIADLAMTMLECCNIGDELSGLLRELLDIDRHRKALLDNDNSEIKQRAIWIEFNSIVSGKRVGARQLARMVSVSPATILAWRKSPKFLELAAVEKYFRDHSPLSVVLVREKE